MACFSLILPVVQGRSPSVPTIQAVRARLESEGHTVEVLVAARPTSAPRAAEPTGWRTVPVERRGRAAAAVAGLESCLGRYLLVLDPAVGYEPEDVSRVAEQLATGSAELVVGSRFVGIARAESKPAPRTVLAALTRTLTGSTDPLSGLVGLTREAFEHAACQLDAVGSQFALELLVKVRGRRIDVPAAPRAHVRLPRIGPSFDDLRHLKKLADHRYGNLSRLLQFCLVGASGMVIDLSSYALWQSLLRGSALARQSVPGLGPLDLAVAAVLAVTVALTWNFSLNRRLTFSDARDGSMLRQYVAYALSNALAVSVNLLLRLKLPQHVPFFDAHRLAAAVVGIVLATGLSFTMSRWLVFRRRPAPAARSAGPRVATSAGSTMAR